MLLSAEPLFARQTWAESVDGWNFSSDSPVENEEDESEVSAIDSALTPELGEELKSLNLSDEPARQKALFGSFGTTHPWQLVGFGLALRRFQKDDIFSYFKLGKGNDRFVSSFQSQSFLFTFSTVSFTAGLGYRPFSFLRGAYVDTGLSVDHWMGHVKFVSATPQSFRVSGFSTFVRLGFSMFFQNRFYLDFCLAGLGVSQPFYYHAGSAARKLISEELTRPTGWGLLNFSVGWQI